MLGNACRANIALATALSTLASHLDQTRLDYASLVESFVLDCFGTPAPINVIPCLELP